MSLRQDRLTFFGVLIAVVIAVLGYLQLGKMYPVQGRDQPPPEQRDEVQEKDNQEKVENPGSDAAARQEDAAP